MKKVVFLFAVSIIAFFAISAGAEEEKKASEEKKAEEVKNSETKKDAEKTKEATKPATSADEVVKETEEQKKEEAAPKKEEAAKEEKKVEKPSAPKVPSEKAQTGNGGEEWKEWKSEEWKEEAQPVKPQLQFLELHGYLRLRGDMMYNMDLDTYNPFIATAASQPNISRGSSKVLPPVEARPPEPSLLKAEEIKDTSVSNLTAAQIDDLVYRGVITRQEAESDVTIIKRRSSYADKAEDAEWLNSANMRFRVEPKINVSEDIRILAQIDMLDNLVLGTTPDTLGVNQINSLSPMPPFSTAQVAPSDGRNSLTDSIRVKRIWGEVMTPVGQLRFGRMGSNWGLGLLANDGNKLMDDYGSTVDRIMFITKLFGFYVIPAFDFIYQGYTNADTTDYGLAGGQYYDVSQKDDVNQYILAIAYKQDDKVIKSELERGDIVLNGGLYTVFRKQDWDFPDLWKQQSGSSDWFDGANKNLAWDSMVNRDLRLWIPDLWLKFMWRKLRIETEIVMLAGSMGNDTKDNFAYDKDGQLTVKTQDGNIIYVEPAVGSERSDNKVDIMQLGAVVQSDYRFLNDTLRVGMDLGYASGDDHGGWGIRPLYKEDKQYNDQTTLNRQLKKAYEDRLVEVEKQINQLEGAADANSQAELSALEDEKTQLLGYDYEVSKKKYDTSINNFRFHPDYRIDYILWHDVIGVVTDAYYFRPNLTYRITEGLDVDFASIYSRAVYKESTPGYDNNLGLEFDLGLHYVSNDNFHFGVMWGILFPFAGMDNLGENYQPDMVYLSREDMESDINSGTTTKQYDPASARNADDVEGNQDYNATTAMRLQAYFAITF